MTELALAYLADTAPTIDELNEESARAYALSRETPASIWWDADPYHPAVGRALRIDRDEEGGVYALAPFRLATIDGQHRILAAYPAPRILGPIDEDWLGITHVIAWDPRTDHAGVLGDGEPQTVGNIERAAIYGSAREFFTAWLRARAEFFVRWQASLNRTWAHGARETDEAPGVVVIGPVDRIPWRPSQMPSDLTCIGIDPRQINRALLRAARIPRAHAGQLKVAA